MNDSVASSVTMSESDFERFHRRLVLRAAVVGAPIVAFHVWILWMWRSAPGPVSWTLPGVAALGAILAASWLSLSVFVLDVVRDRRFSIDDESLIPRRLTFRDLARGRKAYRPDEISLIRSGVEKGEQFANVVLTDGTLVQLREHDGVPKDAFGILERWRARIEASQHS